MVLGPGGQHGVPIRRSDCDFRRAFRPNAASPSRMNMPSGVFPALSSQRTPCRGHRSGCRSRQRRQAVVQAKDHRPDVVLMDIRMPEVDGITATKELSELSADPPIRVLILTTFNLDEYVYDALRAGASGFLLKDVAASQLASGLRTIAAGEALLAPAITRHLIEEFTSRTPVAPPVGMEHLTAREQEIFHLIATGPVSYTHLRAHETDSYL